MDPDPDPYWIRIGIQPKMLDPDPDEMNADPQPFLDEIQESETQVFQHAILDPHDGQTRVSVLAEEYGWEVLIADDHHHRVTPVISQHTVRPSRLPVGGFNFMDFLQQFCGSGSGIPF